MPTVDDINEMMVETSGEVYVELITLEAVGEPTGYLVIDTQELVSRGNTYQPADISFDPAKKSGEELSEASITISNVTRDLIAALDGTPNVTTDEDDEPRLRSTRDVIVDGPFPLWDPPPEYDDAGELVSEGENQGPHFNLYVREDYAGLADLEDWVADYRLAEDPDTPKRNLAGT